MGRGWGSCWPGSLKFDTASVVYADGVFVLLSLLPLHAARTASWYRPSAVLVLRRRKRRAGRSGRIWPTAVYFRYTQKRFSADEIFFADNGNSLQLVGKFMAENWYLVHCGGGPDRPARVGLPAAGCAKRVVLSRGWGYYAGGTAIFAVAAGLSVAGMRGGMTRMTRPITLSNATLYTADSGKANLILSNPFCILRTIGSAGERQIPEILPARRSCRGASRPCTGRRTARP